MNQARVLAALAVVASLVSAGVIGARRWSAARPAVVMRDTTSAPAGQRVLVEVLNSSGVSGLARHATFLIRDRGFDVVGWGNDPRGRRDQTLIIDYTNKPEAALRLSRVLGGADVERGRDSLDRGLDLTVKLGSQNKLPADVFHP